MKYIPFVDTPDAKGRDIMEAVLKFPGERGIAFEEMRKRSRIWDALDANTDPLGLLLEDADANLLISLYRAFPFGAATRDVVKHVSAVVDAKAPPVVALNGKGKKAEKNDTDHANA